MRKRENDRKQEKKEDTEGKEEAERKQVRLREREPWSLRTVVSRALTNAIRHGDSPLQIGNAQCKGTFADYITNTSSTQSIVK